jgi:peroxiredoxin (alkyl hydroperoxide reductase subunit C)
MRGFLYAPKLEYIMSILVGKKAPKFTTQAVHPDGEIVGDYDFGAAIEGKYAVVFFYPLDFTFVCPSEILAMAHRTEKLQELGCEVVGISVDSHFTHNAWRNTAIEDGGIGAVPFTLAADMTRKISKKYGILAKDGDSYYPGGVSMRATFVIDQKGIVRHQVVNDEPLGRNMDEVVRIVEALQFFENHGQVCPAGWTKGDAGMTNTPEGVASYLAENADKL